MISQIVQKAFMGIIFGWKKPTHLILHVTGHCNSRCGMCFAWKRLNHKEEELTLKEMEKIAQSLGHLTFLDISGGEPFLREDLPAVLEVFDKYCRPGYVNIPTNCLLPVKIAESLQTILDNTNFPVSLNLSLDGLPKTHDKIRGVKGNFAKVEETWQRVKVLKKKYPKLSVKISTVVSNQNLEEIKELSELVVSKMKGIDFHTLILMRGNPLSSQFSLPPLKQLESYKDLFFKIWSNYHYGKNLGGIGERVANISHRYFFNLYLRALKEHKMALPCLAGRAHVVIYANGDVSLCELRGPVGNLKKADFDFQELWQSKEAGRQRQEIAQNKCFCTHGCNWQDNVFFNPVSYPQLVYLLVRTFC